MLGISLFVNIAIWIWLFWQIRDSGETFFLHYNILFGVDYIGPRWRIILLPLTGLVIVGANTILGWLMYNRDKFISHILGAVSLVCQLLLFVTASLLVFLNV
jgi:hypothetical protein